MLHALHDITWLIIGTHHLLPDSMSRLSSRMLGLRLPTVIVRASSRQEDVPYTGPCRCSSCLHRA